MHCVNCALIPYGWFSLIWSHITPGRGLKGKINHNWWKCTLSTRTREMLLWCYVGADSAEEHKRPATSTVLRHTPAAKRTTCESTINSVQQLVEELKESHGFKYTMYVYVHLCNCIAVSHLVTHCHVCLADIVCVSKILLILSQYIRTSP